MRNLNIDPDLYLKTMGRGWGMGISKMIDILKKEVPFLQFGYFNRTKEQFRSQIANRTCLPVGRDCKI
jgi:hypothetical protein